MSTEGLSRRERQIMDILYERGKTSAEQVWERLPDPPSYSAVRATLRILERKGHVQHEEQGPRYLYSPAVPREKARRRAMSHLLKTFFQGSPEEALAALLDVSAPQLSGEELDRLARLIEKAKQEEK